MKSKVSGIFRRRTAIGNVSITCVVILGVILVCALTVLNLSTQYGARHEAQNAADAAALEAARDMAYVAVSTSSGQFALVDFAAAQPNHPANCPCNRGTRLDVNQSVTGINTALANVRLCLLIAQDLDNRLLRALALAEVQHLQTVVIPALNDAISAQIKSGEKDSIRSLALNVYRQNRIRIGGGQNIKFTLELGSLTTPSNYATNIRVPAGDGLVPNRKGFYSAYVALPVNGVNSIIMSAAGDQAGLVDTNAFTPQLSVSGIPVAASIVQVSAVDRITLPGTAPKRAAYSQEISTLAVAETGARLLPQRSTVLTVGFAGGMPSAAALGGRLSINSLIRLGINPSARARYQQSARQTWYRSQNILTPPALLTSQINTNLVPAKGVLGLEGLGSSGCPAVPAGVF